MSSDVNLLVAEKRRERKMSLYLTISVVVFFVVVFSTILLVLYILFLKLNLGNIATGQQAEIGKLKTLNKKRVALLIVNERLATIRSLKSSYPLFTSRLSLISENTPSDVALDTILSDSDSITVSMTSPSLASFNSFFNKSLSKMLKTKNSGIKEITIQSFGIGDANNGYDSSVQFVYSVPF